MYSVDNVMTAKTYGVPHIIIERIEEGKILLERIVNYMVFSYYMINTVDSTVHNDVFFQ